MVNKISINIKPSMSIAKLGNVLHKFAAIQYFKNRMISLVTGSYTFSFMSRTYEGKFDTSNIDVA